MKKMEFVQLMFDMVYDQEKCQFKEGFQVKINKDAKGWYLSFENTITGLTIMQQITPGIMKALTSNFFGKDVQLTETLKYLEKEGNM